MAVTGLAGQGLPGVFIRGREKRDMAKVLVIEDDDQIRIILREVLEEEVAAEA